MASTIWKGQLTFGLVSVPIRLFRAARAEKVPMHNLERKTGSRIRQVFVPREEEVPEPEEPPAVSTRQPPVEHPLERAIPRSDLVRGFEFEKGKYVAFEPAELEKMAPRSSVEMQIVEFVRFAEVDPVYLENSYYVAADKGGEKPYALLFEALRKTGQSAIAEFVMHRRDQIMILRPGREGIIGHTLFHEDELKRENEFHADTGQIVPKEMELAVKLIEALAAPFEPEKFKDKYRERLRAAISEKIDSVEAGTHQAPVIDIMTALRESLMQARKPVVREGKQVAAGKRKRV